MVPNADTDGDLRAVTDARQDARGTPAPGNQEDTSWADFAGVSSRELGKTARRLVDALAHRTDDVAVAELRRLAESLGKVSTEPRPTSTINPSERTDPGREPVWDDWFR